MSEKGLAADMPGEPVVNVQFNLERGYAFIEVSFIFFLSILSYTRLTPLAQFRTPEEATAALTFDEQECEGVPLKVRRPKDYIGIDPSLGFPGYAGSGDSPNKLFIGGLPTYLNEEQITELLKSFGELKSFNLVKEGIGATAVSKVSPAVIFKLDQKLTMTFCQGFAFAEYVDTAVTDMAIQGLHNFELGDRKLVVQRAATGRNPQTGAPSAIPGTANFLSIAGKLYVAECRQVSRIDN